MRLDIDNVCAVIERREEDAETDLDKKRLREAAIAVCFLWGEGHVQDFEDLMACFNRSESSRQTAAFDSPEQARTWLMQSQANRRTACISISGVWHSVFYSLDRGDIELIRVPTLIELTSARQPTGTFTDEIAAAIHRAMARTSAPDDRGHLHTALLALHLIVAAGEMKRFGSFLRDFYSKATLAPLRVFDTRQEAEAWLKSHPRPPAGARVEISGQRFLVSYDRESDFRMLVRPPSLEDLGMHESTDDPDA